VAQHISRKELKTDEVRETLAHGAEAVLSHQQLMLYLVLLAIAVAVGFWSWRSYGERQAARASVDFSAAMKVFQAPVGVPPTPGQITYTEEKNKYTDAERKFSEVASNYPRTHSGRVAAYYAALSLEKLDKNEEAKKRLRDLSGSRDEEMAAVAKFELAGLDERTGQRDEAVKLYQELIAKPAMLAPKPLVMLALAGCYRDKNPAEAARLYNQIKSDYPDTPVAQQADQALALLPGKS
jgi:predicted negative regulator of RcsB-dependent stress response